MLLGAQRGFAHVLENEPAEFLNRVNRLYGSFAANHSDAAAEVKKKIKEVSQKVSDEAGIFVISTEKALQDGAKSYGMSLSYSKPIDRHAKITGVFTKNANGAKQTYPLQISLSSYKEILSGVNGCLTDRDQHYMTETNGTKNLLEEFENYNTKCRFPTERIPAQDMVRLASQDLLIKAAQTGPDWVKDIAKKEWESLLPV